MQPNTATAIALACFSLAIACQYTAHHYTKHHSPASPTPIYHTTITAFIPTFDASSTIQNTHTIKFCHDPIDIKCIMYYGVQTNIETIYILYISSHL